MSVRESNRDREPESEAPPNISPIVVVPKMEESEVTVKQEKRTSGRVFPTGAESGAPQNPIQLDSSLSAVRYFQRFIVINMSVLPYVLSNLA